MIAICQLCGERYAEVSINGVNITIPGTQKVVQHTIAPLRYPFNGSMFGSPDPAHGIEPPFDPSLTWEFVRCPFGRTHRPMVKDDLILTEKGMVRLPKDGGPAFLDPTASGEVDRESIGDRVLQVSDEEAERQVRGKMAVEATVPEIQHGYLVVENPDPIPPVHIYEIENDPDVTGFICPQCSKKFPTLRQLKGHQGGAHRPGKKGKK